MGAAGHSTMGTSLCQHHPTVTARRILNRPFCCDALRTIRQRRRHTVLVMDDATAGTDGSATPASGVLLVRAWVQGGRLVGRIQFAKSTSEEQQVSLLVGAEEIGNEVTRWLRTIGDTPP